MSIAGRWRSGRSTRTGIDLDPWSGETLLAIRYADVADIDVAYEAAHETQPSWAAMSPQVRAEIMRRTAEVMHARRSEIAGWLIREGGSTVAKALWECDYVERR
jgi:aldehyde dehydrogenase (NAD+)